MKNVYVVTVKWVAEIRPMKLYERTDYYFTDRTECLAFMTICRVNGHGCFLHVDEVIVNDAKSAYEDLLGKIRTSNDVSALV